MRAQWVKDNHIGLRDADESWLVAPSSSMLDTWVSVPSIGSLYGQMQFKRLFMNRVACHSFGTSLLLESNTE